VFSFDSPLHIVHVEGPQSRTRAARLFAVSVEGAGGVGIGDVAGVSGVLFLWIFVRDAGLGFLNFHPLMLSNLYQF
jgi:hypothetical protein